MNSKNLIGGLLAGAAIGVAIGMLLAPDSGAKTQAKLKKGAQDLGDSLATTVEDSIQSLKGRFTSTVDPLLAKGKEGFNNLTERAKV